MKILKRFILIILFISIIFSIFKTSTLASNINMNLAQEQDINNEMSNTSLNTNTIASVQSVEQFEDNTASFDISNIINILLLAVGFVIILLAVAILIRLNK